MSELKPLDLDERARQVAEMLCANPERWHIIVPELTKIIAQNFRDKAKTETAK